MIKKVKIYSFLIFILTVTAGYYLISSYRVTNLETMIFWYLAALSGKIFLVRFINEKKFTLRLSIVTASLTISLELISGRLRGEKTPVGTSILTAEGMFDTMITDRPYRDKFVQTDAIKYIIEEGSGQFPTGIRKVFLNQLSLFPVNTYVRLNNKSIGRVLCTDRNQPLRPTIELVRDSAGHKTLKRELIKLSENPLLYITESLHERDIS